MGLRNVVRDIGSGVSSTILGLTWRQHIGGRWAVSLVGFALISPVAFLAVFANARQTTPEQLLQWSAISLTSLAVMGLVWWVAAVTLLRRRRQSPAPVWLVVLVGGVSGAARSAVVVFVSEQVGLLDPPASFAAVLVARMATGAAQLAVGVPLVAMTLSITTRYRSERRRLFEQEIALARRQSQEMGATHALRNALADPVRKRLKDLADRLDKDSTAISDVAFDVRAQAHELWAASVPSSSDDRVRFRQVVVASLRHNPLPIAAVVLVWFPSAFLSIAGRDSLVVGAVASVTGALALLAVFLVGTRIVRARPSLGPAVFGLGSLIGGSLASGVAWLFSGGRNLAGNLPLMTVSVVWLAAITLVVSIVEGAVRQSELVIRRLQEDIDAREIELHVQERRRAELAQEVASVLHGVVQGRLAVAQRTPEDSTALARRALDEGIELLGSKAVATATPADRLVTEISAPWSALMDVEISSDEELIPAALVRDVGDVLEECLSNAFRHGGATRVAVDLHLRGTQWELTVSDDGCGLKDGTQVGLGTSLFDAVCSDDWTRESRAGGGCTVRMRLHTSHMGSG